MLIIKNASVLGKNGKFSKKDIFVKNGKIVSKLSSKGAKIIDATGKYITPGLIDAHTHIGICEDGVGQIGWQENEMTEPIFPHLRAMDAIYPEDMAFKDALAAGITAGMITPGSGNLICGETAVCKFHGNIVDDMIVKEPAGMKMALGENPFRSYGEKDKTPSTRMGNAALLREALYNAKNYLENKKSAKREKEKHFDIDLKWESMIPILQKKIPIRMHAHRTDDIVSAIRIAKEFNLKLVIEHATEGHKIADFIAKNKIPCVIGPNISAREKLELRNRSFSTPAVLHKAGVKFAFITDHPVIPIEMLIVSAAMACKAGLPKDAAYKALTIHAAEICGVDKNIGSIESGKDADFVIWNKEPLDFNSIVENTYINGECVYSR
jgi:imidazolonepropionase-like amidohydrolase